MKRFGVTLFFYCIALLHIGYTQSIGINTDGAAPDGSAILDISSPDKGLLVPRMTKAQRDAIVSPAQGLMIYQTDGIDGHYAFNGMRWTYLGDRQGAIDDLLQVGRQNTQDPLPEYHMGSVSEVTDTSGLLYDSGGPNGQYGNNEDHTIQIRPVTGAIALRLMILEMQTEAPYDSLTVESIDTPQEGHHVYAGSLDSMVLPLLYGRYAGIAIHFSSNAVNTQMGFVIRWDWVFPPLVNDIPVPAAGWYFNPSKIAMRGGVDLGNGWHQDSLGSISFAWGRRSMATGPLSFAVGEHAVASGHAAVSLGRYSIASGVAAFSAGTLTSATSLNAVAIGALSSATNQYAVAIGYASTVSGRRAVAIGHDNISSDYETFTFGANNTATIQGATCIGRYNSSTASGAIAIGYNLQARGPNSLATGFNTKAVGTNSTATGRYTQANGYSSFVVGMYNDTIISAQNNAQSTTPLFIVGNGISQTNRSNALVVRKDGHVGIGTNNPGALLHVGSTTGDNVRIGSIETLADGGTNALTLNAHFTPATDNMFDLGSSSLRWDDIWATNGVIQTSDARDKENIIDLDAGLDILMQLRPVRYQWKAGPDRSDQIGLLAQEVQEILPDVVRSTNFVLHEDGTIFEEPTERLGMNYSALIPVLIRSSQELHALNAELSVELREQQSTIEQLAAENVRLREDLEMQLSSLKNSIEELTHLRVDEGRK